MGVTIKETNVIVSYESKTAKFREDQKKLATETSNLKKVFSDAKKQIATFLTGAAAFQVLRNATKTVKDFEVAVDNLSSITGLAGDDLESLAQTAVGLSLRFGTSAKEIVNGFGKVGSAIPELLKAPDALAEITAQADTLSKAAGITLDQAISAVTKTINQYGLQATDAARITDVLATSQQLGTSRITEINEALKNVGSVAAASNLTFEDTNVLLQALAKGGLEGAEAGTKLRSILLRLAKTGRDELNPATQDFNDILKVLSSEVKTVTQAQTLFGEEAASAALTLIKQSDVVATLTGNLNDQGNAFEQALINTDNNTEALKRSVTAYHALILSVDNGNGIFSTFSKELINGTTNILGFLKALNDGIDSSEEFNASFSRLSRLEFDGFEKLQPTLDALKKDSRAFFLTTEQVEDGIIGINQVLESYTSQLISAKQRQNEANTVIEKYGKDSRLASVAVEKLAAAQKTEEVILNEQSQLLSLLNRLRVVQKDTLDEAAKASDDLNESELEEFLTLAKLKTQLGEANKARDQINISDTTALKNNEALIRGLQSQIKALSITTAKTKDLSNEQKIAARAIEALRISLQNEGIEKQIAALKLRSKFQIEDAKGTQEQIATQTLLIEEKLLSDILELNKKNLEALRKQRESFASNLQQSVDDDRAEELRQIEIELQRDILEIKRKQLDGSVTSEEEAQKQILDAQLKSIIKQLEVTGQGTAAELQLKTDLVDAKIALKQIETDALAEQEEEQTKKAKEEQEARRKAALDAVNAVTSLLSEVFDQEKERIENSISLQEKRVAKATELAETGNADLLRFEQERLDGLLAAREKSVQKQKLINSLEIAANTALAVSQGIVGITAAFKEGNVFKGIASSIALAATIASSIISIKSAFSNDVPAFAEGTSYVRGKGTSKSDSISARLSVGEGVSPAEINSQFNKTGYSVDNPLTPKLVELGLKSLKSPKLAKDALSTSSRTQETFDTKALENRMMSVENAIRSIGVSATIDESGFTARVKKVNRMKQRKDKRKMNAK